DQDLYVANDGPNRLYQNDGTGHFSDVAESAGVVSLTDDVSATWGDYDNDGYLDLYVVSNSPCLPPLFYEQDHLFHNEGDGTFTELASTAGVERPFQRADLHSITWGLAFADLNLDGWEDLLVAAGALTDRQNQPNEVFTAAGGGTFLDLSALSGADDPGSGRGVAIADYDRDGRLDAYVVSRLGSPILYRNATSTPGHWLEVDLTGTKSNRDG